MAAQRLLELVRERYDLRQVVVQPGQSYLAAPSMAFVQGMLWPSKEAPAVKRVQVHEPSSGTIEDLFSSAFLFDLKGGGSPVPAVGIQVTGTIDSGQSLSGSRADVTIVTSPLSVPVYVLEDGLIAFGYQKSSPDGGNLSMRFLSDGSHTYPVVMDLYPNSVQEARSLQRKLLEGMTKPGRMPRDATMYPAIPKIMLGLSQVVQEYLLERKGNHSPGTA